MLRRNIILLVALVTLFAAVTAAHAQQVTLRVAIAEVGKTSIEELEEFVADFERLRPHIKIEVMNDYQNSFDRLATHVLGGVAPDIVHFYNEAPILAMEHGFLLDLGPYIARDGSDILDDLLPFSVAQMTKGDAIYGLPFQTSATGAIYYNTQMVDEAGISRPDGSWDWTEFAEVARKLTQSNGDEVTRVGYIQSAGWLWYFPWLVQAGVSFEDPMRVPLNTPQAVQALEYLQEGMQQSYFGWGWGHFPAKQAAMNFSGSWELTFWVENEVPMGIAPVPTGPAGKATLTNTNVIAITSQTEHPEEAWTFLKWLYSREAQMEYLNRFGMQPVRVSLGYEWLHAVEDYYRSHNAPVPVGLETFIDASAYAMPQPFFANSAVIGRYIESAVADIMVNHAPVRNTMDAIVGPAESFLRDGE